MNMNFKQLVLSLSLVVATGLAGAQTSTFVNNGAVHEASEAGSNSFAAGSADDKFFFFLLSAVGGLDSELVFLPPSATGKVDLFAFGGAIPILSYSFATGSGSSGPLAAGFYFYEVMMSSPSQAGSYSFTSRIVPEPETYALLLAGLGAMAFVARRRRQTA
jgi:PEP-CTERM motif